MSPNRERRETDCRTCPFTIISPPGGRYTCATTLRTALVALSGPLVAGLLLAGCGKPKSAGPPPAGPPEVGVMTIQPQRVAVTTELAGRTSAYLVAEVRPQVGGIIQERLFTEGSDVKAGDVLYRIDAASYQAACDSAKAALAKAQGAALASAQAARTRAEANAVPRRLKAERYAELVAINAVAKQDADDATAAVKQSETEIQSADAAVLVGAEADIAGAEAALAAAQINLARTTVTAPISGRIGSSAVTTGALVTANQADRARHDPAAEPGVRGRVRVVGQRAAAAAEPRQRPPDAGRRGPGRP